MDDNIIACYTRQDAIEDGVFIDVTGVGKEAGIKHPVALTSNLYHKYVEPDPMPQGQDKSGRLWDVLWMLSCCCRGMVGKIVGGNQAIFPVSFYNGKKQEEIELWAFIEATSPTDPSPAITIMLPEDY
jgi:hypothetical protein